MNFTLEEMDGAVILQVQEPRLDAHNAGELKGQLLELLARSKSHLVLDFAEVRFIDSSGLGTLIAAYKSATANGSVLALVSLQPQVRSVIELTRLHRVFTIFGSVAEAMERLRQAKG
jgi:anti-sigma B factor antagonist